MGLIGEELVWEYFVVFILAATPWIEILVVIPMAVAYGLHPLGASLFAFIGNALPVLGVVLAYRKWIFWRKRKISSSLSHSFSHENNYDYSSSEDDKNKFSKAKRRARNIFDRYGLPGLALLGPLLTGIYLALLVALALKCSLRSTAIWMTVSLALWATCLGIASFYGLSLMGWLE